MKSCGKSFVRTSLFVSVAVLSCSTGCKSMSGWKMPSWFSGREPDASKMAARSDTTTPTSPATKHTPSAIASNVANPAKSTMTPPSGSPTSTASYPGTNMSAVGAGSAKPGLIGSNPPAGLAAGANGFPSTPGYQNTPGYQTGPYSTNTKPVSVQTGVPNSPVGQNIVIGQGSTTNPYGGGTYTGVTASAPNIAGMTGQMPIGSPSSASGIGGLNNSGLGGSLQAANNGYPTLPGAADSATYPGYGSVTSATATGMNSQVGAATQAGSVPAVSAYQSATPASAYAPGTTGRPNNYNFSQGGTIGGAPASTGAPSTWGTPNTPSAFGTAPTYQAPPNFGSQPSSSYTLPPNTASGDAILRR